MLLVVQEVGLGDSKVERSHTWYNRSASFPGSQGRGGSGVAHDHEEVCAGLHALELHLVHLITEKRLRFPLQVTSPGSASLGKKGERHATSSESSA